MKKAFQELIQRLEEGSLSAEECSRDSSIPESYLRWMACEMATRSIYWIMGHLPEVPDEPMNPVDAYLGEFSYEHLWWLIKQHGVGDQRSKDAILASRRYALEQISREELREAFVQAYQAYQATPEHEASFNRYLAQAAFNCSSGDSGPTLFAGTRNSYMDAIWFFTSRSQGLVQNTGWSAAEAWSELEKRENAWQSRTLARILSEGPQAMFDKEVSSGWSGDTLTEVFEGE